MHPPGFRRSRPSWIVALLVCTTGLYAATSATGATGAAAAGNPWPHVVLSGFSSPSGGGFWLAYANGAVTASGDARLYGDASGIALNGPVLGGAATPAGGGYWLVASDGGIFTYGAARFAGSMGSTRLNQPIFSMTPTKSGRGYWLVARDGGIFSFGDARFYGSAANLGLRQPIVGIMTSPSGNGYRMFARDGGIFSFGDTPFLGSLPGIGIHVTDVVGVAATPTNRGYWIVRQGGQVNAFGDARYLGNYGASPADPVAAAVADPAAAGYRLITRSGRTIPFGFAPGGSCVTGPSQPCLTQLVCRAQLRTAADYQAVLNTRGPLWDGADGAPAVDLQDGRRLWLFGDTFVGDSNATSLLPGFFILRNTAAVEQGNCFDFRLGGTTAAADYLPRPSPNEWLWPMSGFADPVAGVVRVSALRVTTTSGPAGFNFKVESTELVTLDLRTLAYRSSAPMPSGGGSTNWGTAIVATPGWVYLYGQDGQSRQYVARTTRAHLFDGQWQFNTPAGWSTDASAAVPMQFQTDTGDADPGPTAAANVVPYGAGFVLSAKRCEILCDDVTAWYASNPNGPWSAVNSDSGRIATTVAGPCQFTYGGHLVPVRDSPLVLWSVNCSVPTTAKYAYGVVVATPQNLPAASQLASP